MKKRSGFVQILMAMVIISIILVVVVLPNSSKNDKSAITSLKKVDKRVFSTKKTVFNSRFNQAMIMLRAEGIDACRDPRTRIVINIGRLMKVKKLFLSDYLYNLPSYQTSISKNDLNFDSLMQLEDGSIMGINMNKNSSKCLDIFVDFNGLKEPNMLNVDVYKFKY